MTVDVNREDVERRRDRLLDQFGDAPVRERHDTPDAETFAEWLELSNSGYVGSAYALISRPLDRLPPLSETYDVDGDERERVLLILGRGGSRWGLPGGGQEDDETLEATVRREVREEVGLEVNPTGITHLRHEISTHDEYDERLHVLRAFFAATYESGSISVQSGELNGAAWFADLPREDRLLPSTVRALDGAGVEY